MRGARPIRSSIFGCFAIAVFRAAITGGSIFRIGTGATPFLLPLLFQLGFGLTPFQSGMLTFASAVGALAMKFLAPFTLRAGGFRNVLLGAAALSGCFIAANALFTPETPHGVIIAVLIGAGFLRSLFFTSTNALVFADIDDKDASQATAISAASQQITVAIGVAVGGGILEGMHYITGEPIGAAAFSTAFVIVGIDHRCSRWCRFSPCPRMPEAPCPATACAAPPAKSRRRSSLPTGSCP